MEKPSWNTGPFLIRYNDLIAIHTKPPKEQPKPEKIKVPWKVYIPKSAKVFKLEFDKNLVKK